MGHMLAEISILDFPVANSIQRTTIQTVGPAWLSVETVPGEPPKQPALPFPPNLNTRHPRAPSRSLRQPSVPCQLSDPLVGYRNLGDPADTGSATIRRTTLPKSRRVR
jgi:hypothetical protein